MMGTINFSVSKADAALIDQIVDRAEAMGIAHDRLSLYMDLSALQNTRPLDLSRLLAFPVGDFAHDVGGIQRYMDRKTGRLTSFFVPRCARQWQPPVEPNPRDAYDHVAEIVQCDGDYPGDWGDSDSPTLYDGLLGWLYTFDRQTGKHEARRIEGEHDPDSDDAIRAILDALWPHAHVELLYCDRPLDGPVTMRPEDSPRTNGFAIIARTWRRDLDDDAWRDWAVAAARSEIAEYDTWLRRQGDR